MFVVYFTVRLGLWVLGRLWCSWDCSSVVGFGGRFIVGFYVGVWFVVVLVMDVSLFGLVSCLLTWVVRKDNFCLV